MYINPVFVEWGAKRHGSTLPQEILNFKFKPLSSALRKDKKRKDKDDEPKTLY